MKLVIDANVVISALIVEKSGLEQDRVEQFTDLLFQYIEVVSADDFYPAIDKAQLTQRR